MMYARICLKYCAAVKETLRDRQKLHAHMHAVRRRGSVRTNISSACCRRGQKLNNVKHFKDEAAQRVAMPA